MSGDPATLVLRGCDALVRPGDLRRDVDIAISGNRIATIEPTGAPLPAGAEVIDARRLLALPGLVNAHTHSPETCLRGSGEGLPLEPWLARMFGTAGVFDEDDHRACALAGALEMLLTGATSVVDHVWMTPPSAAGVDAVLGAYAEIGIRAAVAPLVFDADSTAELADALGVDVGGALLTDVGVLPVAELLAQLEDLVTRWNGAAGGRLQVFAGPCGPQWCSDELLTGLAEAAGRHGIGVHIHVLESPLQIHVCRLRFEDGPIGALDRIGLLGPNCSLAHGVWLDPEDVELIADRGAVVVHNPSANFRLGSGRAPIPELLGAGAKVALGADGSASSDNQVLWTQLKLAALIHNDGVLDRWVSGADALRMATEGGAAALGLSGRLGALEPGFLADVVVVDLLGDGLAGAQSLEAGLALSETGRAVRHVVVDGQVVLREGRCTTVDEKALVAEIESLLPRLDEDLAAVRAKAARY
ncbi:MAG TPA: amidohydrolase family protein, partial [Gaiellaceae bacterium]|nr:amidohydrolase family protein [Gaiellaceae bacterium]